MDSRLAESFVNRDDHVVLGRKLHDFCLYDVFLLALDGNPLYLKHRKVEKDDLLAAVSICSSDPERFMRVRTQGLWAKLKDAVWKWKWRRRSIALELRKWEAYVDDFDARPVFWEGEGGEPMKAPWVLSVLTFLEDHTNMGEREIMTAPLGKMLWKSASLAEQLGMSKSQIMTEEEEEALKEMGVEL